MALKATDPKKEISVFDSLIEFPEQVQKWVFQNLRSNRNPLDAFVRQLPLPASLEKRVLSFLARSSARDYVPPRGAENLEAIKHLNPQEGALAEEYLANTREKLEAKAPKPTESREEFYRVLSRGPTLVKNRAELQIPGPARVAAELAREKSENPDVVFYNWGMGSPRPGYSKKGTDCLIEQAKKSESYAPALGTERARRAVSDYNNARFGLFSHPTHASALFIAPGGRAAVDAVLGGFANHFKTIGTSEGQGATGVLSPSPAWPYPPNAEVSLVKPVNILETVPENGFKITPENLQKTIEASLSYEDGQIVVPRVLVITNPYNPSGVLYTRKELEALVKKALEYDLYILEDQVYERLVYGAKKKFDPKTHPFVSIADLEVEVNVRLSSGTFEKRTSRGRTIFINGLSKNWGRADLRLGWAWTFNEFPEAIRDKIFKKYITSQGPTDVNGQAYLSCLLEEDSKNLKSGVDSLAQEAAFYEARAKVVVPALNALHLKTEAPESAFYVLSDTSHYYGYWWKDAAGHTHVIKDDEGFTAYLLKAPHVKERIAVVPASYLGKPGYVRIAFGVLNDKEIPQSLAALRALLQSENLHPPIPGHVIQNVVYDRFPSQIDLQAIDGRAFEE